MATYTGTGPTGWWESGQPVSPPAGIPPGANFFDGQWYLNGMPTGNHTTPEQLSSGGASSFSPEGQSYLDQQAEEKAKNQAMYESQGYSLEAHPYQFDPTQFQNPYYAQDKAMLDQMLQTYQGMQSPQISAELKDLYMNQAKGIGPSIAEASFQKSKDEGISSIMALRASTRGSPGASNRAAMYNIGNLGVQGAQDLAIAKMQEAEAGKQGWLGIETTQGKFDLAQSELNNQMVQYFVSQGLSLNQAQWAANIKLQELQAGQHSGAQQTMAGIKAAEAGQTSFGDMLAGGLINAAAAAPFLLAKPGTNQQTAQSTQPFQYGYNPATGQWGV